MLELICSNPIVAVICIIMISVAGKYLFVSKDYEKKIAQDINTVSKNFIQDMHNLELNIARDFGSHSEKIRVVQKEIMDEADKKYFTKEMAEKHNERISKMEEIISEILPRMQKLDIMYDIVTKDK